MLKGIAASSGVVVAKAYKLEQPTINVVRRSADSEQEIANFKQALLKTQKDIEIIKTKAIGKLSDDELAKYVRTDLPDDFWANTHLPDEIITQIFSK